jgi:acetolactate synthase-1/2/3 large subunit
MTRAATVAEVIADAIGERGAGRVFAFPGGGSNLELIDALARRSVAVVLARSEGGAAFMAATYADLTGRPATLLVGLGPGVANAVNGIAHAWLDQSAVIVISDRFAEDELGTSGHQVLDHAALLAPVVKWQALLTPDTAASAVHQALSIAAAAAPGPVHLSLPREVALAPAAPAAARAAPAASEPRAEPELSAIAEAVAGARRPVVLVGDEALDAAQEELVALVERLGAPVLSTYKAKGAFPERHPLWCGIVTNAAVEAEVLEAADVLISLGVDPVELLPRPWSFPGRVVALRRHGEDVPGLRAERTATGDVAALVHALAERLDHVTASWDAVEIGALREAMLGALRVAEPGTLSALDVVAAVRSAAPEPATVTVDAGAHMFAVTWGWRVQRPRRFLISNGLASMGFAVPAAVAAALARPAEPVIAFTGDGGFLMHGAELETAVRTGARVVVVVLNDASLSLIRIKQADRGYPPAAVDFGAVDAAGYARSLGASGVVAENVAEVREAVAAALQAPGPAVVDVRLTGAEYQALQHAIRTAGAPTGRKERAPCVR